MQFSVFANLLKSITETRDSTHASSSSQPVMVSLSDDDFFEIVGTMISIFANIQQQWKLIHNRVTAALKIEYHFV